MTTNCKPSLSARVRTSFFIVPALLLAGCSPDVASIDDVYVPTSAEQRFPIEVVEAPVKLTVPAQTGRMSAADAKRVASFARTARRASSPVSVSYPSASKRARGVSQEIVALLVKQGVPRSRIHASAYSGKSDVVALSFHQKVATTKECGDWSENVALNQFNEPYPNFGCFYQNNFAAMVKNPDDFERPRDMSAATADSRMEPMEKYNTGEWSVPQEAPDIAEAAQ